MDFPAPARYATHESVRRSWPRAAIVVAAVAAVELIVLIVIALAFIAKPFASDASSSTKADAKAHSASPASLAPRAHTRVLVLNGNGVSGAASSTAKTVRRLDYPVVDVADASRQDFARTLVMYGTDGRAAGLRLARDLRLGARDVIPLDGMRPTDLHGAQLALIVGRESR